MYGVNEHLPQEGLTMKVVEKVVVDVSLLTMHA